MTFENSTPEARSSFPLWDGECTPEPAARLLSHAGRVVGVYLLQGNGGTGRIRWEDPEAPGVDLSVFVCEGCSPGALAAAESRHGLKPDALADLLRAYVRH